MKCTDCPYYWKEESDEYPCCHFDETYHATPSPCEYDDVYGYEEETEEYQKGEYKWIT